MDTTKKLEVKDAHEMDKKIPRDLIIMYQNKPYITYAGLLWKANNLFKGGEFGIVSEIIERSPDYVLAKATFKTKDGVEFSNFGEASKANVSNTIMHKYMLHLAVTRAMCRVLRTATACGYVSSAEMAWGSEEGIGENNKEIPISDNDNLPMTKAQEQTIISLKGKIESNMTQKQAKEAIAILVQKK